MSADRKIRKSSRIAGPKERDALLSETSTLDPRLLGAALPFVLILVALNVIVIVAMLAYATTEYQASRNSVQAETARALAQSGIDLAAGLISANSTNNAFVTYQRVPQDSDNNYRLETKIANVVATNQPWQTKAVNPVILHSGFATGTNGFDLNYAADSTGQAGYIAPRTNGGGWTNLSTNMFRMDWIYVFKTNAGGSSNVVGRIAYWVDDESSKLNVNYSGNVMAYGGAEQQALYGEDVGKWTSFSIQRPNLPPSAPRQQNFLGRKWPIFMELGGVAGMTTNEAIIILRHRSDPTTNTFNPFPSVLGLRIATNTVATDLQKQSSLAFTATIYSKEEERTYATGIKRFDLLNMYVNAPSSVTNDFYTNIVLNYPQFDQKYDLRDYSSAAYHQVQWPGYVSGNSSNTPTLGFDQLAPYTRGLPLMDEFDLKAIFTRDGDTNVLDMSATIDLMLLSASVATTNNSPGRTLPPRAWAWIVREAGRFNAEVSFEPSELFGITIPTLTSTGVSSNWFTPTTSAVSETLGPQRGAFTNAMAKLTFTTKITNTNNNFPVYSFPTNITVKIRYNNDLTNQAYQTIFLTGFISTNSTNNTLFIAGTNQTNVVHYVGQPKGDDQYRGDPRFGVFTSYMDIVQGSTNSNLRPSIGTLNTNVVNPDHPSPSAANWRLDVNGSLPNSPDLNSTFFFALDRGIPMYLDNKGTGFGPSLSGVGWIGEIPVTTRSAPALAWSTPRLWGNGRSQINSTDYPPDWLLMDCFHLAAFPQAPQFSGSTNEVFSSYGRINVNSAKHNFQAFQPPFPSTNKTDTILDSIFLGAQTLDYDTVNTNGSDIWSTGIDADLTKNRDRRTNFIGRVTNMVSDRNRGDNPYTTPFAFLAELAATNLPSTGWWWMAPGTNTGSIYTATNTTDRRAEGIVRSLAHKLTTHGNQFMIFSVGQALQPSATGTVEIPGTTNKANVAGEAYLQAVYERAPQYDETTGAITNSPTGAPPMRQLFLRELR